MNDGSDGHGNHPGSGQHDHHHHHDRGHGPDHGRGGPEGSEFLDLEISKVLHGEAGSLAREAALSILRGAIEARLRERLGARLEAIGHLAADELADDVEANLAIEATIASRREAHKSTEARAHEVLRGATARATDKPGPKRKAGR